MNRPVAPAALLVVLAVAIVAAGVVSAIRESETHGEITGPAAGLIELAIGFGGALSSAASAAGATPLLSIALALSAGVALFVAARSRGEASRLAQCCGAIAVGWLAQNLLLTGATA